MTSLFRNYLRNLMLAPTLVFTGITTFFMLFFAVILANQGLSTQTVALHYLGIFSLAAILVSLRMTNRKKVITYSILAVTPMVLLIADDFEGSVLGLSISLALISSLAITVKDLVTQQFQSNLVTLAYRSGTSFTSLNTFSFLVNTVFSFALSFVASMVLGASEWLWSVTAALWVVSVMIYFRYGHNAHIDRSEGVVPQACVESPVIPSSVTFQCLYSTAYGGVFYTARYFLLPTMVFQATVQLGFEKFAFQAVVASIGGITLFGMLIRQFVTPPDQSNDQVVARSFLLNNVLWIMIAACGYWAFYVDGEARWPYIAALGFLMLLEMSSKVWTISFFSALNDQAVHYSQSRNSAVLYDAYMKHYIALKNFGGVYGFAVFLLMSLSFTPQVTLIVLCLACLLFHTLCFRRAFPVHESELVAAT